MTTYPKNQTAHGNYLPPKPWAQWWVQRALSLCGWRIEGALPKLDKFVIVGAHHTSNWDFILFLAVKTLLRLNPRWFAKHSLFFWPLGVLFRRWGGIAIRRHLQQNSVEQAVQSFNRHEQFILIISPEGTRQKVERWRMGFYHIACGAKVPIVLVALDCAKRRIIIGPALWPSGDSDADLKKFLAFFRPYPPKKPHYAFLGD